MKRQILALALSTTLLLTACSPPSNTANLASSQPAETTATGAPEAPDAEAPAATSSAPSPRLNDRGQVVKSVGELAWAGDDAANPLLEMTVTGFKFVKCDGVYARDIEGYVLAVDVEMKTGKDFVGGDGFGNKTNIMLTDYQHWSAYESDGTKMNDLSGGGEIQNCFDDGRKLFPDYLGKGEKGKGQILLGVSSKSGEVSFEPFGEGGWVWKYPEIKANA